MVRQFAGGLFASHQESLWPSVFEHLVPINLGDLNRLKVVKLPLLIEMKMIFANTTTRT